MFDFDNSDLIPPFCEDVRDAIDRGDLVGMRQALDKGGGINIRFGKYRASPIHFASKKHSLDVVEELIKRGADINATDRIDDRPLHEAVRFGEQSILLFLLEKKANPNVQNSYGDSPLMYCFDTTRYRTNGWTKKAKVLLDHGANKDIKNHHGKSAVDHLDRFLQMIRNGHSIKKEIRNSEELAEAYHLYDILTEVDDKGENLLLDVIQSLQKSPDGKFRQDGQDLKELCESALILLRTRDWDVAWEKLDDVPSEIHELGTITEDMFLRSLETKQVQTRYIRLMIVGDVGVGKTTLCLNLIDENEIASPTDGINVFIQNYQVNMKTGKWQKLSNEDVHNLPTKLLSTACRAETSTGNTKFTATMTENTKFTAKMTENTNITEAMTENANITETMIENANITETMTGNTNITETLTGNTNITETMAENTNITETMTENANITETMTEKTNITTTMTGNIQLENTTTRNENITETITGNRKMTETQTRNRDITGTPTRNMAETGSEEIPGTEIVYTRVSLESQEQGRSSPPVKRRRVDSEKMRNYLVEVNTSGVMKEDDAVLSIWDFAGDEIYEATHHIFMSPDAVYIIVFNSAECLADKRNLEKLYTWQEVIRTYSTRSSEQQESSKKPQIILVGTHLDTIGNSADERNANKTKLLGNMENVCSNIKIHFVNNRNKDDPAIQRIRDEIVTSAPYQ